MKYFTPEMYVRFNEAPDELAEETHEEWERAGRRYERRYKKIESQLPSALRRFNTEQCLHDGDWNGIAQWPGTAFPDNSQEIMIIVCQENTLIPEYQDTFAILQYTTTAPPLFERPVQSKVFDEVQPTWLYDEIDVVSPGVFSHSILISSGLVVTIHFRDFRYFITPLLHPTRSAAASEERRAEVVQSASA